ncbi:hypothetical protein ACFV3E_46190 [Streptomyces sp. NPDC059718]
MDAIPPAPESVVDLSSRPLQADVERIGVAISGRVIGQEWLSLNYILDDTASPESPAPAEQPPLVITLPMPPEVYWAGRACVEIADKGTFHAVDRLGASLALSQAGLWREAVSTAVAADWGDRLRTDDQGALGRAFIRYLRAEAQTIHRQLRPLWRRRAQRSRVLLLDTPMGDGLSLHDLVNGSPDTQTLALGADLADQRLAVLLGSLTPEEGAVVMAWTHPAVATWADAALYAGAADPVRFGERVRRKTGRWVAERQRRREQQQLVQPSGLRRSGKGSEQA